MIRKSCTEKELLLSKGILENLLSNYNLQEYEVEAICTVLQELEEREDTTEQAFITACDLMQMHNREYLVSDFGSKGRKRKEDDFMRELLEYREANGITSLMKEAEKLLEILYSQNQTETFDGEYRKIKTLIISELDSGKYKNIISFLNVRSTKNMLIKRIILEKFAEFGGCYIGHTKTPTM